MKIMIAALLIGYFPVLVKAQKKSYQFDKNGISKKALDNYLEKAVTMVYLLIPENPEGNRTYPNHADDIRMIDIHFMPACC